MATPLVGADVESICGKCGDVWHVVVAKVGDKIAKVQCKQCGALHRHSPPAAVRERERLAREAARAASRTPGAASSAKPKASRAPKPPPGPSVQADPSRPPRPYKPTETFAIADTVLHPSFGTGVVELVPEPGKMQVYFADGRRVLVMGRGQAAPLLTRRRPESSDEG